ncbi:G3E family GTPase [Rhodobium orientis]|uniref:GTP-binding protein n=1 Tax=Rhodobium orientis TaxID=34017 RepID=A0A327JIR7_9HYPH|nr:GTP-binding protein [Rhodobium orientis]MBB4305230.1 G3E family GTPase [Rhodobium orientis]MBK5952142.1 GTP-binding protein [Rhodobium orientis]RAI26307.1 GTP-binding protein [Rhodobium orientis]
MSQQPDRRRMPIPITILTGFLGSGKTTLLNRLISDPAMADAAVIINEFGEVGLDHMLVEAAEDGIVELSSGCLCCTVRGDLVKTLEDFLRRLDNGRLDTLSRIVIETTGLADPAPILHAIMLHPYLVLRYRLDGVVTTVDAVNGMATLDAHEEAVKQVAVADRIVLTKTDIAEDRGADALRERLAALNPGAPVVDAAGATAEALLNCGLFDPTRKIPDVARWLHEEAYRDSGHTHDHGHSGGHHHHHDVNRHDDHIRAFSLATDRAVPATALEMFIDLLRSAHGPKLLRVKGIVKLAEDPERPVVIHGVQEVFHPPATLPQWPDDDHRTRLVFITSDMPEEFVSRMFEAIAGTPVVDTPDAAALTDNPLAVSGFSGTFKS